MFPIKILDENGKMIGELMTPSAAEIGKFINLGFTVINIETNEEVTMESITDNLGVSDGSIILG